MIVDNLAPGGVDPIVEIRRKFYLSSSTILRSSTDGGDDDGDDDDTDTDNIYKESLEDYDDPDTDEDDKDEDDREPWFALHFTYRPGVGDEMIKALIGETAKKSRRGDA